MLTVASKLIDSKTGELRGVICSSPESNIRLALTLSKAQELGAQDIEIIQYLACSDIPIVWNSRDNNFAYTHNCIDDLEDYKDIEYRKLHAESIIDCKIVLDGKLFKATDFIDLDNKYAIRRFLEEVSL